jgi:hypothetical protein
MSYERPNGLSPIATWFNEECNSLPCNQPREPPNLATAHAFSIFISDSKAGNITKVCSLPFGSANQDLKNYFAELQPERVVVHISGSGHVMENVRHTFIAT